MSKEGKTSAPVYFFELADGFDYEAYNEHYEASKDEQKNSKYTEAMKSLFDELINKNIFSELTLSEDFHLIISEHSY